MFKATEWAKESLEIKYEVDMCTIDSLFDFEDYVTASVHHHHELMNIARENRNIEGHLYEMGDEQYCKVTDDYPAIRRKILPILQEARRRSRLQFGGAYSSTEQFEQPPSR